MIISKLNWLLNMNIGRMWGENKGSISPQTTIIRLPKYSPHLQKRASTKKSRMAYVFFISNILVGLTYTNINKLPKISYIAIHPRHLWNSFDFEWNRCQEWRTMLWYKTNNIVSNSNANQFQHWWQIWLSWCWRAFHQLQCL